MPRRTSAIPKAPCEAAEQTALFAWARMSQGAYPELEYMFAIPNGGSRHLLEAVNLKRQGVKPGVPDICLPVPRGVYAGMYIELKRIAGGRLSGDQDKWLARLRSLGYYAVRCDGFEAAKNEITKYIMQERGEAHENDTGS